jgi:malonyl-CoA O-methyltransferase
MGEINRAKARTAFDRGSASYDDTVVVQKRVIGHMTAQLEKTTFSAPPMTILDVGAGTGILLRSIGGMFPRAFMVGLDFAPGMGRVAMSAMEGKEGVFFIEGDAERLPFKDGSFDLVLSTSVFQWLPSLEKAFGEVRRVMSSGGTFRFALFGGETLRELRNSHHAALRCTDHLLEDRTHSFFTLKQVEEALAGAGFSAYHTECLFETEYHEDVLPFLRSLRRIGAGNASKSVTRGLAESSVMKRMVQIYRRDHGGSAGIPATYEVICGQASKM